MTFTDEQWRSRQEAWRRSSEETIAQLRADLATVTVERDAWRAAHGTFGPQTPDEVAIFEQEGRRVENETRAHEIELALATERAAHEEMRKALVAIREIAKAWREYENGSEDGYCAEDAMTDLEEELNGLA